MNIAEILKKEDVVLNHEGAEAFRMSPEMELYTAVVTSALEEMFYEGKNGSRVRGQARRLCAT